jgi:hypothetical protein
MVRNKSVSTCVPLTNIEHYSHYSSNMFGDPSSMSCMDGLQKAFIIVLCKKNCEQHKTIHGVPCLYKERVHDCVWTRSEICLRLWSNMRFKLSNQMFMFDVCMRYFSVRTCVHGLTRSGDRMSRDDTPKHDQNDTKISHIISPPAWRRCGIPSRCESQLLLL